MQILFLVFALMFYNKSSAQSPVKKLHFLEGSDSLIKSRSTLVTIGTTGLYAGTMTGLYALWYKDAKRDKFHFFDDTDEWLLMDKTGHMVTSYQLGRLWYGVIDWTGAKEKNSLLWGGAMGSIFLSSIEIFDGFSEDWGFSIGDIAANTLGSALFISQQKIWNEQRVGLKFSFNRSPYSKLRPNLLGEGLQEEILKDYNGQTYWITSSPQSWIPDSGLPAWLGVAVGYGADGMTGGKSNPAFTGVTNENRIRQYYLSLDIDLSKIEFRSRFLNTFFSTFSFIRIPAPTLEYTKKNGLRAHALYF